MSWPLKRGHWTMPATAYRVVVAALVLASHLPAWAASDRQDKVDTPKVVFRVAAPAEGNTPADMDRVRGPGRKPWFVHHDNWARGDDVLDVLVSPDVALHLTVTDSVCRRVAEGPPDFVAVYVDGTLFGVGSVVIRPEEKGFVIADMDPRRAVKLAEMLGAEGAMAAGPRLSVSPRIDTDPRCPCDRGPVHQRNRGNHRLHCGTRSEERSARNVSH